MLSGIGGEGVNSDKSPAERAPGRKQGRELEAAWLLRKRDAVEPTRRGGSRGRGRRLRCCRAVKEAEARNAGVVEGSW